MIRIYIFGAGESEVLASRALEMYSGRKEKLRHDDAGRPYFDSACISITHSGDIWACALSDRPCGIDVQQHKPVRYEKLAARYFTEKENSRVKKEGENAFFEIWAAKEAYAKLTGKGLAQTYRTSPFEKEIPVSYFDAGDSYTGCVCSYSFDEDISVFHVD